MGGTEISEIAEIAEMILGGDGIMEEEGDFQVGVVKVDHEISRQDGEGLGQTQTDLGKEKIGFMRREPVASKGPPSGSHVIIG